ncbi:hypothetical protein BDN71DRAFT_1495786 [Pleurotus eryngii]|uniref:Uncharacterized protein n=1 Tax=Pleurotus eryngii TaxID=5323 RepID=A0A9P6D8W0_PLEER|nr:hypothetical protein BDN71DRAFT_1495786 [Pleurotus eryngii]
MATALPVEIARMIVDYIEDKGSLLNLLVTTHAFRLLAELHLYAVVSFLPFPGRPAGYEEEPLRASLWDVSRSLLRGITTGGGRCARYVKRLHLTASGFRRREQYTVFQAILKLTANLEDLYIHPFQLAPTSLNLQTLLEDPQGSPPPFTLRSFGWYLSEGLGTVRLDWFLSHHKSIERLFIPFLPISDSSPSTATLPRLRVLHTRHQAAARRLLRGNHVTHLKLSHDNIEDPDDAALRNVVICALQPVYFSRISTVVARMPNLVCLEIQAISRTYSPVATGLRNPLRARPQKPAKSLPKGGSMCDFTDEGATKLRYLRILPSRTSRVKESPWDFEDVVTTFNNIPSLTHIIVQVTPSWSVPHYCWFARGAPRPVKLRSMSLKPEWWRDDWIEHCVVVPFKEASHRVGYTDNLLDGAGPVEPPIS